MDLDATLRTLNINLGDLDPAPAEMLDALRAGPARIKGPNPPPCSSCGAPAVATRAVDVPGHGARWLDRCRGCFLVTAK